MEKARRKAVAPLPIDLVTEILSRLPAICIVRFRCCCKMWHSATLDPAFIKKHLRTPRPLSILRLFPDVDDHRKFLIDFLLNAADDRNPNDPIVASPYISLPKPHRSTVSLNHSCNGLLCFALEKGLIQVTNPATRETLTLIPPTWTKLDALSSVFLGFLPESNQYKVVRFFVPSLFSLECEVHTLGGPATWRKIPGGIPFPHLPFYRGATNIGGKFYWLSVEADSVFCFDLRDEIFTHTPLPFLQENYGETERYQVSMVTLEVQGFLGVSITFLPEQRIDVWVLNSTTAAQNWNRQYSLSSQTVSRGRVRVLEPLFIGGNRMFLHRKTIGDEEEVEFDIFTEGIGHPISELFYYRLSAATNNGGHQKIYTNDTCRIIAFSHVESLVQLENYGSTSKF